MRSAFQGSSRSGRPVVDPDMRGGRGRDGRGKPRLGHHVQPVDLGRMLGDRGVVDGQIVDEGGDGGAWRSMMARAGTPLPPELHTTSWAMPWAASWSTRHGCASSPRLVRMTMSATSPIRPSASTAPGTIVWRCISLRKNWSSRGQTRSVETSVAGRLVGHRLAEIAAFEGEVDAMRLVQPGVEMRHHVQQHFVAVGDQQRAVHVRARARRQPAPRALRRSHRRTAIRSGSWSSRKRAGGEQSPVARALSRISSELRPVSRRNRSRAPFVGERRGERGQRQRFGVICRIARHRLVCRSRDGEGSGFGQDPGCRGQCAEHQVVLRPARRAWA